MHRGKCLWSRVWLLYGNRISAGDVRVEVLYGSIGLPERIRLLDFPGSVRAPRELGVSHEQWRGLSHWCPGP